MGNSNLFDLALDFIALGRKAQIEVARILREAAQTEQYERDREEEAVGRAEDQREFAESHAEQSEQGDR
jgi:hypothetical protein